MPCSNPSISLIPTNGVVFSLGTTTLTRPFPYNIVSGCTPNTQNSVPTCSFSTNNANITSSASGILFPPTVALGQYSASVACSEGAFNSTTIFNYIVVFGRTFVSNMTAITPPTVPDCIPTVIDPSTLSFSDDGGVTASMIVIQAGISTKGDYLAKANIGTFNQIDVNNGSVYFQPSLISNVKSSRIASVPITALDPSANTITTSALYNVQYTYCPQTATSPIQLTSNNFDPASTVLSDSLFSMVEPHGLSVWDISWAISSIPVGRYEWFCPDSACGGPGWIILLLPATIKQSWVLMNAIRWNPVGAVIGINYVSTWTSVKTYLNGLPLSTSFNMKVLSSATASLYSLPYYQSASCPIVTLGKNGIQASGLLPFGPFDVASPLRPLCFTVQTSSTGVTRSDISISTPTVSNVTISGAIILGPDFILPTGFIPLNFTGFSSKEGQLYQAIQVTSVPSSASYPITITLPQTTLDCDLLVKSINQISILKYNPANGQLSHIAPQAWIQDSLTTAVLRITAVLPTSGYYIFGYMNFSAGNVVPVTSNALADYLPSYGYLPARLDSGPLSMQFISSVATKFAVMRPVALQWSLDGFYLLDSYYFTGLYATDPSIIANYSLSYNYPSSKISWALQATNSNYSTGYFWNFTQNSTLSLNPKDGSYFLNLNTSTVGLYGVFLQSKVLSASSLSRAISPCWSMMISFALLSFLYIS